SPDLTREHSGQPASLPPLPPQDIAKRRGAIYAVAPSFLNVRTLWAGTDDGLVWITRDQGKSWKDVTPPLLTPWSKVTQISASPFDDDTAYASVSRFRLDDLHPYLYRTRDGGATWQSISKGLADNAPVNTVRADLVRKGLLFAGTETAIWMSLDEGDHWQSLQLNLPHTSMRDFCNQGNDLVLATHGRSIWVLDDISPLRQLDATSSSAGAFLFKPGEAIRVRRSTNTDTPIPSDEPAGQNPPDGAALDYYLARSASGPVTLEILDAENHLVRRYASDDAPAATPETLNRQLIPLYWIRMPRTLSAAAGMHRWIWDLRHAAPAAANGEYPISAIPHDTPSLPEGPLALPGLYTVRLTVDGHTSSARLAVRMDPRVSASSGDLTALFTLESHLASLVSSSAEASLQAQGLQEQVQGLSKKAPAPLAASLASLDKDLSVLRKGAGDPMKPGLDALAGSLGAIYAQVGQADAHPTEVQESTATRLSGALKESLANWDQIRTATLPGLNRQLREAHLDELNLKHEPQARPGGRDED
ncbi:MAG TPA: hypothetical protein VNV60_02440, partial [Holophagaceae bacterium]|nr:hypothetical protein [Holophagaceae bacterium]